MFSTWCLLIGVLLILIVATDTVLKRLPVSAAAIYLGGGYLLGPEVADLIQLDVFGDAPVIEMLTEVAVLVSLFAVGLRLRVHLSDRLWLAPVMMASVGMLITIVLVCGLGMALGFSFGMALLLAGILAPTDPVLASDVQVEGIDDRDRLRFSLTGEGGLNDGAAFSVTMLALGLLGLHELGPFGWRWLAVDVIWATGGGLLLGWAMGYGCSRAVVYLRRERDQALGMESFLTLGLIAITYGLALHLKVYGFLAVFAAGLAMRHVEHRDSDAQASQHPQSPKKDLCAYMAKSVLDFTLDLERLAELAVMLVVGSLLSRSAFTATSFAIAIGLLFVARPIAIWISTQGLSLTPTQRRLAAWFGIRGIGSMYYLAYVVAHGAEFPDMRAVSDAVLVTIALSVLLHGSSATPFMDFYRRARGGERRSLPSQDAPSPKSVKAS
jgi:NhaP-type Na+/H+ or K+/H+ antiporter